ncbi:hypothetical protein K474DRAFT_1272059 [Panus rudis PR-1116 ss-1]|nr:hypothetical protein K474DRAFT_1272059 [Panus rudis PR-1116 ss-1]
MYLGLGPSSSCPISESHHHSDDKKVPSSTNSVPHVVEHEFDDDRSSTASSSSSLSASLDPDAQQKFAIAQQETEQGILYIQDDWPTEGTSYLAEPYRSEPLEVKRGDQIVILEEVSTFTLRVKLLKSGAIGLLPLWNTEDPLERLARLNMQFNEAATCPVEMETRSRSTDELRPQSPTEIMHVHARCMNINHHQNRRMQMIALAKQHNIAASSAPIIERRRSLRPGRKTKTVNIPVRPQKTVFRYYQPAFPKRNQSPSLRKRTSRVRVRRIHLFLLWLLPSRHRHLLSQGRP